VIEREGGRRRKGGRERGRREGSTPLGISSGGGVGGRCIGAVRSKEGERAALLTREGGRQASRALRAKSRAVRSTT